MYRYARENLALVNIYIKDPSVSQIKRDQRIPVIWFIANVGGILGLSMGCSLVTIFEIVHHLVMAFLSTGKKSISGLKQQRDTDERERDAEPNRHNEDGQTDNPVSEKCCGNSEHLVECARTRDTCMCRCRLVRGVVQTMGNPG